MRLRITWIIVGLLTAIILSNFVAIYNIVKLFILNRSRIKSTVILTTEKYSNIYRTSTRNHVKNDYQMLSALRTTTNDAAENTDWTTLKHRRRYKFDRKLGKYVRIRKPELEKSIKENLNSNYPTTGSIWSKQATMGNLNNATNDFGNFPIALREGGVLADGTNTNMVQQIASIPLPPLPPINSVLPTSTKYPWKISVALEGYNVSFEEANDDVLITNSMTESFITPQTRHSSKPQLQGVTEVLQPSSLPTKIIFHHRSPAPNPRIHKYNALQSKYRERLSNHREPVDPSLIVSQRKSQKYLQKSGEQELKPLSTEPVEINHRAPKAPQRIEHSDFTLVTALLDIGRGDWWEYRRPLASYYMFMENLLRLKVNLIIFVDQKSVEHVRTQRKYYQLDHITKIIPITLAELPLHQYLGAITDIIASEQSGERWNPEWDHVVKTHPEAKSAEYDILVNSKPYFLYNASISNPFSSEYFAWLDAGYAHGNQTVFPPTFQWQPILIPQKISIIKITPSFDNIFRYTLVDLYRKNWAVISGGFLGGDRNSLKELYQLFHHLVVSMIHRRLIDDEQTTLVLLIQQKPSLFNVKHGSWFDAFRLFS